jgi:hypothetical protein
MRKAEETTVPIVNVLIAEKKDIEVEVEDIEVEDIKVEDIKVEVLEAVTHINKIIRV